jgi:4-hydroxybenzoate polyprenyltransferase
MLKRVIDVLDAHLTRDKIKAFALLGRYPNQTGTQLLFWPCAWGVALGAANPLSAAAFFGMGVFYFGSFNLRSAGCAVNDILDQRFDSQVERTKNRPLAKGDLNTKEALAFTSVHLSGGLLTLCFLKYQAIVQSLLIFPFAMAYPLAKRYTFYPQVVLGFCFNIGVVIGFTQMAAGGASLLPVLPFYLGGVLWTLIYDTTYGLQDAKDDHRLGLKSTALLWGKRTKQHSKLANVAMLASFAAGGLAMDFNCLYYLGLAANHWRYHGMIDDIRFKDPHNLRSLLPRQPDHRPQYFPPHRARAARQR